MEDVIKKMNLTKISLKVLFLIFLINCDNSPKEENKPCVPTADIISEIATSHKPKDVSSNFNSKSSIIKVDKENIYYFYSKTGINSYNNIIYSGIYLARSIDNGITWQKDLISPIADDDAGYIEPIMNYDFYENEFLICFNKRNNDSNSKNIILRIVEFNIKDNRFHTVDIHDYDKTDNIAYLKVYKDKIYSISKDYDNKTVYLKKLYKESCFWQKSSYIIPDLNLNGNCSIIFNKDIIYVINSYINGPYSREKANYKYEIVVSYDEGKTWSKNYHIDNILNNLHKYVTFFINNDIYLGILIYNDLYFYSSQDEGKTWNKIGKIYDNFSYTHLRINENILYFFDSFSSRLIYTHDIGKTWNTIDNIECDQMNGVDIDIYNNTLYCSYLTFDFLEKGILDSMKMARLKIR